LFANCFKTLVKYVGNTNYAYLLLNTLKILAGAEKLIFRDKEELMKAVFDIIPTVSFDHHIIPT
jgi:hypothetical protein